MGSDVLRSVNYSDVICTTTTWIAMFSAAGGRGGGEHARLV